MARVDQFTGVRTLRLRPRRDCAIVAVMQGQTLDGRHALITGGGSGIGAAIARHLHAAGAKVSLLGRRMESLEAVAADTDGTAISCDITDRAAIEKAYGQARTANGPIDYLVVNAGIADSAPFHKMKREDWDRIMAVNLTGAFDCAQAAMGDLLSGEDKRLVFIASVASLRGIPYAAHYGASKHGLLGLTRALAREYAQLSLTVNAICPGYVDTPMTDQSVARIQEKTGRSEEQGRAAIEQMNAHGRLVSPEAIAAQVLTLCLPISRDTNGAAITIDGGTDA